MSKKRRRRPTPQAQWGEWFEVPVEQWLQDHQEGNVRCFGNGRYTVFMRTDEDSGFTHLSLHNTQRSPVRDWRHLQRIKNELCGPEREAVEIFPAESRLLDVANEYHLWVFPDGMRIPLGFDYGRVTEIAEETIEDLPDQLVAVLRNAKQRPAQQQS